nr:MAG TPA: hypothetical protein [Crassvirales sp.]
MRICGRAIIVKGTGNIIDISSKVREHYYIRVRVIIYIREIEARALAKAEVLLYQLVIIIKQVMI